MTVHVAWHPRFGEGAEIGRAIFKHLFEDPDDLGSHGARIPVFHWRSTGEPRVDAPPPRALPLAESAHPVVVPLVDDEFRAGPGWFEWIADVDAALPDDGLLLPVRLSGERIPKVDDKQVIDVGGVTGGLRLARILAAVSRRLWARLGVPFDLEAKPGPVFVSYAQSDGKAIANDVTAFLDGRGLRTFCAPRDVPFGAPWRAVLREHARDGLLLAIRTDAYAGREWCQVEVLEAKRAGLPVVVLDAFERREPRGFPYLGNAPVLRWQATEALMEELLVLLLREALRFRYFERRVAALRVLKGLEAPAHVVPTPPELLTLLRWRDESPRLLVYPDPPLGSDELSVIHGLAESLEPVTPLMVLAS